MSGEELMDLIEVPDMETPASLKGLVDEPDYEEKIEVIDDVDAVDHPEIKKDDEEEPAPEEEQKPEPKQHEISDEDYSYSVRKRINKAVAKQKAADERAAAAEAKAEVLEKQLAEFMKTTSDDREKDLLERRKQAVEDGNLESVNEINDQLMDVRLSRQQVKPAEVKTPEPATQQEDSDRIHPSAEQWIARNSWYLDQDNPENAKKAAKAEQIQDHLLADGWDFGDDLYYELDKRLSAQAKPAVTSSKTPSGSKPGHLSAPSPGGTEPQKPKPGQLTEYDKRTIRAAGLDPNNADHRAAYLKRKAR